MPTKLKKIIKLSAMFQAEAPFGAENISFCDLIDDDYNTDENFRYNSDSV